MSFKVEDINLDDISHLFNESTSIESEVLSEIDNPVSVSSKKATELDIAKSKYPKIAKFLLDRTKSILDAEKLSGYTVKLVDGYSSNQTRIEEGQRKFIEYGESLIDEAMTGMKYFKIFYAYNVEGTNLKLYTTIVEDGVKIKLNNSVKIASTLLEEVTFALCTKDMDFSTLFPSIWEKYYPSVLAELKKQLGE